MDSMYLVLFKPQNGEKTTAYSFVSKEVLANIPVEIIQFKKFMPTTDLLPSKELAQIMVEKYDTQG